MLVHMDYLFWRKNIIVEIELDRNPYPWTIWYIWKVTNNKLFRGIYRDHLKLVLYAESECQAWFNTNEKVPSTLQDYRAKEPQVLRLSNICMVDGSWTFTTQFSGCGWVLIDSLGKVQLMDTQNCNRREYVRWKH